MQIFGVTDVGAVRKINQDNYVVAYNEVGDMLAIICDGIGGGNAGDVASKCAIDYFSDVFSKHQGFRDIEDIKVYIRYHVRKANDLIFMKSVTSKKYRGMGTTFVALLRSKFGDFMINIGDSRIYAKIDDKLQQITVDHTYVQDLVNSGEITAEMALNHPKKNVLTNALGIWDNVRIDIEQVQQKSDGYLICSDGLYGYVEHYAMEEIMNKKITTSLKVRRLLNLALKNGGYDNITIIVIELGRK